MSNKEIEVKLLIDFNEDLEKFFSENSASSVKIIEQNYLSVTDKEEIRIRHSCDKDLTNNEYFLTIKSSGDVIRTQEEFNITEESYLNLLKGFEKFETIKKERYCIPFNNYILEFDFFLNDKLDFILLEVEVDSLDDLKNLFFLNDFSFIIEDVTKDKSFKNKNLWLKINE